MWMMTRESWTRHSRRTDMWAGVATVNMTIFKAHGNELWGDAWAVAAAISILCALYSESVLRRSEK